MPMRIAVRLGLAAILVLPGCSNGPGPTEPEGARLGVPFSLGVGESVSIRSEAVRLGFDRVTSDSRCPPEAVCVWQGEANAVLWFQIGRALPKSFELSTVRVPETTMLEYRIRLLEVAPTQRPADPGSYRVRLVVTK